MKHVLLRYSSMYSMYRQQIRRSSKQDLNLREPGSFVFSLPSSLPFEAPDPQTPQTQSIFPCEVATNVSKFPEPGEKKKWNDQGW
jgi:hypothetical protein